MTSTKTALLVPLAAILTACAGSPPETTPPPESTPAINTLTDQEKAEGWTLLFDGRSLDQWRGFRAETVPPGWGIEDGLLVFNAEHGEEGYGDLMTREQFADFDLSLEWKLSPCGNSGVLFRVSEDSDQEWHSGPEVQIVDGTLGCWSDYQAPEGQRAPGSDLKPTQLSGANYDLHPPAVDAVKPVGEWNHMRIIVKGPHVEHWLNGTKVVDYELWNDEWKQMVAASKFHEYPKYGMNPTGHIVLQDHGKTVWFRNIKIKRL
ncbi:MAG: DUF1080 domain-containing protein [Acidobacteriota bacterium]